MTKHHILPSTPTEAMILAALEAVPASDEYMLPGREEDCVIEIYDIFAKAAPGPTDNTELVEKVARWLAVHYKDPPATAATGFYLNSKWPHFVGGAQDLLKCIEGKE